MKAYSLFTLKNLGIVIRDWVTFINVLTKDHADHLKDPLGPYPFMDSQNKKYAKILWPECEHPDRPAGDKTQWLPFGWCNRTCDKPTR